MIPCGPNSSIDAPVACAERVVHLVNLPGSDQVRDEAYKPLTSNRTVERLGHQSPTVTTEVYAYQLRRSEGDDPISALLTQSLTDPTI
jgi:hypothetical protein